MDDAAHAAGKLIAVLGERIEAPDEETFEIFSHDFPSSNLGFIDSKAKEVEVSVAGKDYTIRQSPGLLSSNRKEGTTGAVVWKVTPLFAEWVSSPQNALFNSGILDGRSVTLELGTGVSGLVALAMAPRIQRYIATDQEYVLRLLRDNLDTNHQRPASSDSKNKSQNVKKDDKYRANSCIDILPLDWETSSVSRLYSQLQFNERQEGINALIACDCIYNEALIAPLVETSRDICSLAPSDKPTICIVAQQLRSSDVFELWLETFHKYFIVWRVPDALLNAELRVDKGYTVHIGLLRDSVRIQQ